MLFRNPRFAFFLIGNAFRKPMNLDGMVFPAEVTTSVSIHALVNLKLESFNEKVYVRSDRENFHLIYLSSSVSNINIFVVH